MSLVEVTSRAEVIGEVPLIEEVTEAADLTTVVSCLIKKKWLQSSNLENLQRRILRLED